MSAALIAKLAAAGLAPELLGEVAMALANADASAKVLAERRERARLKKQKQRENIKATSVPGTGRDVPGTPGTEGDTVSPKEIPPTPPKETTPSYREAKASLSPADGVEEAFERFSAAYPKRKGADPRKPALQRFTSAVKAGTDADAIASGAKAYAQEQAELGKVGTQFIKTREVWLNQRCWEDYAVNARAGPNVDEHGNWLGPKHLRNGNGQQVRSDPQENPEPADAGVLRGRGEVHRNGEGDRQHGPVVLDFPGHAGMGSVGRIPDAQDRLFAVGDEGGPRRPPH